jgi:uncharacterized protein YukE
MAQFTTDYELMEARSKDFAEHSAEYAAISRQLLTAATSMGAAFESKDNDVYVERITEFCNNELKRMADKLAEGSEMLHQQAQEYRRREEENVASANTL